MHIRSVFTFSEGKIFMCPSIVVVKSYISEGTSSAASTHRSSHSHSRHTPLEWISLHGPTYTPGHGLHHVCRSTRVATATPSTVGHVHRTTLLRLARIVLRVSSLLLLLLFLSVGNTARVLLGFFRTTCTAPHDELLTGQPHSTLLLVQYLVVCFLSWKLPKTFKSSKWARCVFTSDYWTLGAVRPFFFLGSRAATCLKYRQPVCLDVVSSTRQLVTDQYSGGSLPRTMVRACEKGSNGGGLVYDLSLRLWQLAPAQASTCEKWMDH